MANLDKCVSLFLTWVQHLLYGMDLLGRFRGNMFFYWFQGLNLLVDGQKFKMWGDIERERIKYFYFSSIKTYVIFCSWYFSFFKYYTKKEIPSIKLMTALLF